MKERRFNNLRINKSSTQPCNERGDYAVCDSW